MLRKEILRLKTSVAQILKMNGFTMGNILMIMRIWRLSLSRRARRWRLGGCL